MTTTADRTRKLGKLSPQFPVEDSFQACLDTIEAFYDKGWTDGLPVVPPTQKAVQAMLATVGRDPKDVLGPVPPRNAIATVENVAVNAVMAGCKPEYLKVVLAAVEAMLEERHNLNGLQATTNAATPLAIVSGPVVKELGINYGTNLFGHGYRANATIGRAIRLVMTVLGGGYPETGDKSPLGQPGKFSFCIAESPESPWEPLHVERGLSPGQSGVTMVGVDAPFAVNTSRQSVYANDALRVIAGELTSLTQNLHYAGEVVLVLNPLVANLLSAARWSKEDVKWYMYEKARAPLKDHTDPLLGKDIINRDNKDRLPMWLQVPGEDLMVPVLRKPQNLVIVVAGGGHHHWSALCPGWGYYGGWAVTKPIRE